MGPTVNICIDCYLFQRHLSQNTKDFWLFYFGNNFYLLPAFRFDFFAYYYANSYLWGVNNMKQEMVAGKWLSCHQELIPTPPVNVVNEGS